MVEQTEQKKRTNVRLPETLHTWLKGQAAHGRTTVEALLQQAVHELRSHADRNGDGLFLKTDIDRHRGIGMSATTNIMPFIAAVMEAGCKTVTLDDLSFLISLRGSLAQELNGKIIRELLTLRRSEP